MATAPHTFENPEIGRLFELLYRTILHPSAIRKVLCDASYVHATDHLGRTPLHLVTLCKLTKTSKEVLNLLLGLGANIHARDHEGETPLFHVKCPEMLKTLVERGGDINAKNNHGLTPLQWAVRHLNVSMLLLQAFVECQADLNVRDSQGCTPLYNLIRDNNQQTVLLTAGADVDVCDSEQNTPLHVALISDAPLKLIQGILKRQSLPYLNMPNRLGQTPLHYACFMGNSEIVRKLLRRKVQVDSIDHQGKTPLHYASHSEYKESYGNCRLTCWRGMTNDFSNNSDMREYEYNQIRTYSANILSGQVECIELLIHAKANPQIMDKTGKTPRHYALDFVQQALDMDIFQNTPLHIVAGCRGNRQTCPPLKLIQYLLSAGANVHSKNCLGNTPLLRVCQTPIARLLLEAGSDVNAANNEGMTLLHYIMIPDLEDNREELVTCLLEYGINVNATDNHGNTPLHAMITQGRFCVDIDILQRLLQAGANPCATNQKGQTPLDVVSKRSSCYRSPRIIDILTKAMASAQLEDIIMNP